MNKVMKEKCLCPVCGKFAFTRWYEYCATCNWNHNPLQEEFPDDKKMENIMSLNEAKQAYKDGIEIY